MALRFNMDSGVLAGPDITASVKVFTSIALTRTIWPTGINSIITSLPCIASFMRYYNLNSSLIESLIFMLPDTIAYLDYFGTIVFAITGCLVAARRQSDILAFILLGLATAVGGGTLRDILIGRLPVFWIEDPIYIILCVVTAITMFIGLHRLTRIRHYHFLLNWADAVGLSTFTIIGTHVAITSGIPIIPSILLGVSTACFGGVIRDLLSGHSTLIMRNDVYMTASIIGAIVYIVFIRTGFESYAVPASFISSLTMRGLAIQYDLKLPGHKYFENDA